MKDNNIVRLVGTLKGKWEPTFVRDGTQFYQGVLEIARRSETVDYIPAVVSERMLETAEGKKRCTIRGRWELCERSERDNYQKMQYYVLADSIEEADEEEPDENFVHLKGEVCREPFFKISKVQKRKITNVTLRADNGYQLRCIVWGANADYAKNELRVGSKVEIQGRIQSRLYYKEISPGAKEFIPLMTYEVSVSVIGIID